MTASAHPAQHRRHIEDAAAATAVAVEHGWPGVYSIVDDDPAPVREWLPVLASALDAKLPRRVPRWLGRLAAGDAATFMMTEVRGASTEIRPLGGEHLTHGRVDLHERHVRQLEALDELAEEPRVPGQGEVSVGLQRATMRTPGHRRNHASM